MDGFCNQKADLLGCLAGLSFPVVYVGVVECAPASPYTYSSTHRFPDERTPIEVTPLPAPSAELGLGLGLGLGSHSSSHAPLLLATLLSLSPSPRTQLYHRSCSNKHTHSVELCLAANTIPASSVHIAAPSSIRVLPCLHCRGEKGKP